MSPINSQRSAATKSNPQGSARAPKAGARQALKKPARAGVAPAAVNGAGERPPYVLYLKNKGVDGFVNEVHEADPMRLIETERRGVASVFVKDLSKRMGISAQRMFDMVGVPKATAEKKVAAGELLAGSGGRATLGIARLLGIANEVVANSTAQEARDFDTARWLGQWLETPQAALGGRKPADVIETPTGLEVVAKLLGAIESGAYQ